MENRLRLLGINTVADSYPLPYIHDFSFAFAACTVFSPVDLVRAYNHIPVADEGIPKTAVATLFGLFEWTRMPMGLRNSVQTFQRFIDDILRDLLFAYAYLDDLLMASSNLEMHAKYLRIVLQRLKEHGITINVSKSAFGQTSLKFLRHEVSSSGIRPLPTKIEANNIHIPPIFVNYEIFWEP